jgi:oxygen-independent coproporphyrinogen-3 oxidase
VHLYVHVPFCARRCSYCDFAIAVRRRVPDQSFVDVVLREWAWWRDAPLWAEGGDLTTVYFGGGTPSRLAPAAIGRLLARFGAERPIAAGAEVTLEANPEDVTDQQAAGWLGAGVTRVSLGVQSFDPAALRWMHRVHGAERPGLAVRALRRAGFANVSLDLIYGLPAGLGRDWAADLDRAMALEPQHLSLYGLTVEPRTPLGRWVARGETVPASDGRAADEYLRAAERLTDAGFRHYEVSNAARPGFESRHNQAYWRRAAYLGLGPSAHSAWADRRSWNAREWEAYRTRVLRGAGPVEGQETLGASQIELERRYLGLRTADGLPASSLPAAEIAVWVAAAWARRTDDRIALTALGWLRLDALVRRLA